MSKSPNTGEQYVTRKFWSYNCSKTDTWDSEPDNPEPTPIDPDDPNQFPTVPEGPSYVLAILNKTATSTDDDWEQLGSNTSLTYIEKTSTGDDPEDYDGTLDRFYLGYQQYNTISYYTPATVGVNCIVTYSKFFDTYVEGDYY
jgi:hypothetical protein